VIYVSSKCVVDIEAKLNTDMMAISAYLKTNDLIINLSREKQKASYLEHPNEYQQFHPSPKT
jgi:hypothetical protein